MKRLTATLRPIGSAVLDATRALPRSWPAALGLAAYSVLVLAASTLLAPLGFAGGLVVGLVHAAAIGSYLCLLEIAITQRRPIAFTEIQESFGTYLWEVISVLWIFFLAQVVLVWILQLSAVWLGLMLVAFFAFNPAPELIYQGRSRGLELLGDTLRFVRQSGLTWFPAQVLILIALGAILPQHRLFLLQAFGPSFGFLDVGGLFFTQLMSRAPTWQELAGFAAAVLATHWFLLFRGFLFKAIGRGGRRLREWQERLRG